MYPAEHTEAYKLLPVRESRIIRNDYKWSPVPTHPHTTIVDILPQVVRDGAAPDPTIICLATAEPESLSARRSQGGTATG